MKKIIKRGGGTKAVGITFEWKIAERPNHNKLRIIEKEKIKKDKPILNKSSGGEGRIAKGRNR